jgi:hypothetical protein
MMNTGFASAGFDSAQPAGYCPFCHAIANHHPTGATAIAFYPKQPRMKQKTMQVRQAIARR